VLKYIILSSKKGKYTVIDITDNLERARKIAKTVKERSKETIILIPYDEKQLEIIT